MKKLFYTLCLLLLVHCSSAQVKQSNNSVGHPVQDQCDVIDELCYQLQGALVSDNFDTGTPRAGNGINDSYANHSGNTFNIDLSQYTDQFPNGWTLVQIENRGGGSFNGGIVTLTNLTQGVSDSYNGRTPSGGAFQNIWSFPSGFQPDPADQWRWTGGSHNGSYSFTTNDGSFTYLNGGVIGIPANEMPSWIYTFSYPEAGDTVTLQVLCDGRKTGVNSNGNLYTSAEVDNIVSTGTLVDCDLAPIDYEYINRCVQDTIYIFKYETVTNTLIDSLSTGIHCRDYYYAETLCIHRDQLRTNFGTGVNSTSVVSQWNTGANFPIQEGYFNISLDPLLAGVEGTIINPDEGEIIDVYLVGYSGNASTGVPNANGQMSGIHYQLTRTNGELVMLPNVERRISAGYTPSQFITTAYNDLNTIAAFAYDPNVFLNGAGFDLIEGVGSEAGAYLQLDQTYLTHDGNTLTINEAIALGFTPCKKDSIEDVSIVTECKQDLAERIATEIANTQTTQTCYRYEDTPITLDGTGGSRGGSNASGYPAGPHQTFTTTEDILLTQFSGTLFSSGDITVDWSAPSGSGSETFTNVNQGGLIFSFGGILLKAGETLEITFTAANGGPYWNSASTFFNENLPGQTGGWEGRLTYIPYQTVTVIRYGDGTQTAVDGDGNSVDISGGIPSDWEELDCDPDPVDYEYIRLDTCVNDSIWTRIVSTHDSTVVHMYNTGIFCGHPTTEDCTITNENETYDLTGTNTFSLTAENYWSVTYTVMAGSVTEVMAQSPVTGIPSGYTGTHKARNDCQYLENDFTLTGETPETRVIIRVMR